MENLLIAMYCRAKAAMGRFRRDQRGASDMVAVIVLIVIVVAIAVIFRDGIKNAANSVIEKLNEFITGTN